MRKEDKGRPGARMRRARGEGRKKGREGGKRR